MLLSSPLPYPPQSCQPTPNPLALFLSSFLILGLIISYLPQHIRIITSKSSEGLSSLYLLLGSIGSACGVVNLGVLGWGGVRCCEVLTKGACLSSLLGLVQVTMQWLLFSLVFVLYLIYLPTNLKYTSSPPSPSHPSPFKRTHLWKVSLACAGVTAAHLVITLLVLLPLLDHLPLPSPNPTSPPHPTLKRIADVHGLLATLLAILQYAPQIHLTLKEKIVGALSIPTMLIQVPGSVLFVVSIAMRENTAWTSWFPYAITGLLQSLLLLTCLAWRRRQARLGLDDFGRPIVSSSDFAGRSPATPSDDVVGETEPLLAAASETTASAR